MDKYEGICSYPDNYFDWAIVDPPYKIKASRPSIKPDKCKQKNGRYLKVKRSNYKHKDWDDELMNENYFKQLFRVSKNQIIWGCNYQKVLLQGGRLIWDKLNGLTDQYDCEIAYLSFTKRTDLIYYLWSGMFQGAKVSRDVREALKQKGDKRLNEKRIHPTQKPVALYFWMLKEYAKQGMKILDTHTGSASSLIACEILGFEYVAFEKDRDIFNDANIRIKKHKQEYLF